MQYIELIDSKIEQLENELDLITDDELDIEILETESRLNELVSQRNLVNIEKEKIKNEIEIWKDTKNRVETLFVEPI